MNKPPPNFGGQQSQQQQGQQQQPMADRSARSVFVGNISYEVAEETLKQVFGQVGPVVHMRLVYDRETGKPKGYGFCEYADQQTAELAIRNLNGYELNGRQLRVDSAAGGERSADEVAQLQMALGAQQNESPYGPEPAEGKATEAISRSVSSLPPEKMFELMKQMKDVCRTNPEDAKQMLISHPQLAYALLQAQVVMRIVEPQLAIAMLHRETPAGPTQPFTEGLNVATVPPPGFTPNAPPGANVPSSGAPSAPPVSGPSDDDQQAQAQLLMQVLQLSESEIALLPPGDRERVIELRNQLRQAV